MSTALETKQGIMELEARLVALRCELRHLKGKANVFLMQEHEGPAEGFTAKEVHQARYMRKAVAATLAKLDEYDSVKSYYDEFENQTLKLMELWGEEKHGKR